MWPEISNEIAPLLDKAMAGNEGTYVESQLLIMERYGYAEETYYTFSYSPIPDDDGSPGGIICANTDDTQRVIGERQLALLRTLAAGTAEARTWQEACTRSATALCSNPRDVPFALVYITDPNGETLTLAGSCGVAPGHPAAPEQISATNPASWPVVGAIQSHQFTLVDQLHQADGHPLPSGAWNRPPSKAAIVPIAAVGQTGKGGVLVVGLNPFRKLDDGYRNFLTLVAGQISASIANAQAYEAERERAESLAELDRAKTTFFSNVSHEFRTPLTLMLGPLQEAIDRATGVLPEPAVEELRVVHRNGLRLLKLVNTLLDFSRIEAGRVQAHYQPTDLAKFTSDLASIFRSAIERSGMQLKVDCNPIDEPVYVDRSMWEKIVLNLLSNAFKFTFDGTISVAMRKVEDSVEVVVRDTGCGIPDGELPRLFERFHRVEGTKSRTHEGTGIGLALVQELVRLHGGTVNVESKVGDGSQFTVRIPLGRAHLPADRISTPEETTVGNSLGAAAFVEETSRSLADAADDREPLYQAEDLPAADPHRPRARIVLADDNADMRRYVRRLLSPHYDVEAVSDGTAGAGRGEATPSRPGHQRRHDAEPGWIRLARETPHGRRQRIDSGDSSLGAGRRGIDARRPQGRCGRLPGQAVHRTRVARANQRAVGTKAISARAGRGGRSIAHRAVGGENGGVGVGSSQRQRDHLGHRVPGIWTSPGCDLAKQQAGVCRGSSR